MRRRGLLVLALAIALAGPTAGARAGDDRVRWAIGAGGPGRDDGDGIGSTPDGGVVVAGGFDGTSAFGSAALTSAGGGDVFALGLDRAGRTRWARRFGGPGRDQAFDADVDRAGRGVLTGTFSGSVDFGVRTLTSRGATTPRYGDAFVLALARDGRPRWVRGLGGTGSDGGDEVAVGPRDDVFVVGDTDGAVRASPAVTLPATGGRHAWAARFGADGRLRWARSLGGPGLQVSHGISAAADATALVTGEFRGVAHVGGTRLASVGGAADVFVTAVGARGRVRWARAFGGPGRQIGRGVDAAPGGDLVLAGEFAGTIRLGRHRLTSAGGDDLFLARLDRRGRVRWATAIGGPGDEVGPEVEVDAAGTTYLVATFAGAVRAGGRTVTGSGARSALVAAVSPAGRVRWTAASGAGGFTTLGELSLGPRGVSVLGRHAGPARLGPFALPAFGRTDLFVARLAP